MNRARYDGLDPALRGAIDAASGSALAERFGDWWDAWAGPAREAVRRRGNTISVLAPGERERWARAAQPAVDRWLTALEADGVSEARAIYETASAMAGA